MCSYYMNGIYHNRLLIYCGYAVKCVCSSLVLHYQKEYVHCIFSVRNLSRACWFYINQRHLRTYISSILHYTQTCTHIPTYVYVLAHIYTDVYICTYTDMHTHTCTHKHTHTYIHTHAYTHTHTCTYIHTYIVILYFVTAWITTPVTLTDITPDDSTGIKLLRKRLETPSTCR